MVDDLSYLAKAALNVASLSSSANATTYTCQVKNRKMLGNLINHYSPTTLLAYSKYVVLLL
jgi:hypothetical protein